MPDLLTEIVNEVETEPRWPAAIALILVGVAYLFLPSELVFGPRWLVLLLSISFLLIFWLAHRAGRHNAARWISLASINIVTIAILASTLFLTQQVQDKQIPANMLLRDAALIWCVNVLAFAIWYWELDAGGPAQRKRGKHTSTDLLFPQMTLTDPNSKNWSPNFIDYLFLAFNTSTAFSPTDTLALSRRIKLLMMLQSLISVVVIVILAARAINTL